MFNTLDWIIVGIYCIGLITLATYVSRTTSGKERSAEDYFLASIHRQENVDLEDNLKTILETLNAIANKYDKKIIVSTHPRTKDRLDRLNNVQIDERINFLKPFGFFDYLKLQKNALTVISDSGTISEESSILNFPAITIRKSMERPEALDSGSIILTGLDKEVVLKSIDVVIDQNSIEFACSDPIEYQVTNTSWRILKLILGTSKLSNKWSGIEKLNFF